MAAHMLDAANSSIEVDENRFILHSSGDSLSGLCQLAAIRLGAKAMVMVTSANQSVRTEGATHKPKRLFFPVRIVTRIRQQRTMLHRLLRELELIDEQVPVHQLVPPTITKDQDGEQPLYELEDFFPQFVLWTAKRSD